MKNNVHHTPFLFIKQAETGKKAITAHGEKSQSLLGALKGKFILSEDFHLPDPELESLFYKDRW